ncbi:MAG: Flp family type IVb pilin [Geminicoccaceae bacterium]|nr:Flp family type IVb pilin [Geminicoccaceae bacterium]
MRRCQRGAVAIEYGLIVALVVIAMLSGLTALSGTNGSLWGYLKDRIDEGFSGVTSSS